MFMHFVIYEQIMKMEFRDYKPVGELAHVLLSFKQPSRHH